jgi:hypothetical protein
VLQLIGLINSGAAAERMGGGTRAQGGGGEFESLVSKAAPTALKSVSF